MRDAGGGGSIINITSIGGILAGGGVMTYRASKAAVIQFTKSAAIELAHYEIRVNAIAPGNIRTAIVRKSAAGEDLEKLEEFEAKIRETMRDDRPLKREGTARGRGGGGALLRHRSFQVRHRHRFAGRRGHGRGQGHRPQVQVRRFDRLGVAVCTVGVLCNEPRVSAAFGPEDVVR